MELSGVAVRTACDVQVDGRYMPGRSKMEEIDGKQLPLLEADNSLSQRK